MIGTVLVAGCGSIGRRHIRNLRALEVDKIFAFDLEAERLDGAVKAFDVMPCTNFEEGLDRKPEVVLVCTPPNSHTRIAQQSLDAGCHVFIEKPLANDLSGVDELLQTGVKRNRVIYVGYNLRFNEGLLRLREMLNQSKIGRPLSIRAEFGQYLPDWRPKEDYRRSYTSKAEMGGGIILDASHELDYVRWLAGEVESVYCTAGHVSDLDMDAEDIAEITMRIRGNIVAHVHLDCIQRGYTRNCKVIGEKGSLLWDFRSGVRHFDAEVGRWVEELVVQDPNEMYLEEIKHFLACSRGEVEPAVDGKTGKRILEIALAALRSATERREVIF